MTKDFEFLRELGKGGYGSVYLVKVSEHAKLKLHYAYQNGNHKHREIPDIVALKKIHMGSTISQAKIQSVNKEAVFLQSLSHPNLITCFYSFFDQELIHVKRQGQSQFHPENRMVFCILMEYSSQGDLQNYIEKHKRQK